MTDDLNATNAYEQELSSWREQYAGKLAGPYGWWSITTLTWLESGVNLLGSVASARVPLHPRLPGEAVRFELDGAAVTVTPLVEGLTIGGEPATGPVTTSAALQLFIDADPEPVRVNLIRRGELTGVRVYDPAASAARDPRNEIAWFPLSQRW